MRLSTNAAELRSIDYATPWGRGRLYWRGGRLVGHRLPGTVPAAETAAPGRLVPGTPAAALRERLQRYFAGDTVTFRDLNLNLSQSSSVFAADVAAALAQVGYGETIGYAELARRAGHPRAQRAVGNFLARNPYPLILPCHRIVLSDGRLGSFSAGDGWKRRLLELEGVSGF